jgi:hypothetical protein
MSPSTTAWFRDLPGGCAKAFSRAKDTNNNKTDIEMVIRFMVCPPEKLTFNITH